MKYPLRIIYYKVLNLDLFKFIRLVKNKIIKLLNL